LSDSRRTPDKSRAAINNPDPLSWLRLAAGVVRQTDKSSGFYPLIVVFFLCLLAGISLLFWQRQDAGLKIFALSIITLPLLCFILVFAIKAFTDPNFCRSERHIERMAKVQIEMMGTEKIKLAAEEIQIEKLERPTMEPGEIRKLTDKNRGDQNL
jgi:hypothetical protein